MVLILLQNAYFKDIYIVPRGLKEFVIYTKKSVWYLKARTSQDRDDWIEKLKSTRFSEC